MKRFLKTTGAAVLLALAAGAVHADTRQLAASAGLGAAEAAGLSLAQIAQAKFDADGRPGDRHPMVRRPAAQADPAAHAQLIADAGLTAAEAEGRTLAEIVVAKSNRDARGGDRRIAIVSGREGAGVRPDAHAQLIAAAGLDAEAARGMTLAQVAAAKIGRESSGD